ncbi:hypothetical protein PsYK624_169020 [Phanerochaete sordida]|uniref:Uncharacterized protein n=1 Tax=Phanerochaete sordida TaxID=48140 RepID=A0A9P3GRP7_9APHY|nr:hypothetical protein PsYK624_169020 [Phanerochaete sordida]
MDETMSRRAATVDAATVDDGTVDDGTVDAATIEAVGQWWRPSQSSIKQLPNGCQDQWKHKVWCARCLEIRIKTAQDEHKVVSGTPVYSKFSLQSDIADRFWGPSYRRRGWIEDRACNCLRHLRDCDLQPPEVRQRAKEEHETRHLAPRRVAARRRSSTIIRAANPGPDLAADEGLGGTVEELDRTSLPEHQLSARVHELSLSLPAHPTCMPPETQPQAPATVQWYDGASPLLPTSSSQSFWHDAQAAMFGAIASYSGMEHKALSSTPLGAVWDPLAFAFAGHPLQPSADTMMAPMHEAGLNAMGTSERAAAGWSSPYLDPPYAPHGARFPDPTSQIFVSSSPSTLPMMHDGLHGLCHGYYG